MKSVKGAGVLLLKKANCFTDLLFVKIYFRREHLL